MDVFSITYEEAKKRCLAESTQTYVPASGGCVEKYIQVFGISSDKAGKLCATGQTPADVNAVINRCQELEKKLKDTALERDILKKAMAIFSRTSK